MEFWGVRVWSLLTMMLLLVVVSESGSGSSSLGCLERERMGLLELKNSLFVNSSLGLALPSWRSDSADCCNWERVACGNITGTMRVTQLLLDTILEDTPLNASLFDPFEELRLLNLAKNKLQGITGKLRLKKLRFLDLNHNYLPEAPSLDELPSLTTIDFYFNPYMSDISNLEGAKLEALELSYTDLKNADSLQSLWGMASLKALLIGENGLNSSIFPGLCGLTSLEELYIGYNEYESEIPLCLCNMTSLRTLDLSFGSFRGAIPSQLFSSLSSLEFITLAANAFEGSISLDSLLANNSKLEGFELVDNEAPLSIETENPLYSPPSQMKLFRLSNCTLNRGRGGLLPSFLLNQHELRKFELSYVDLKGDFPTWLLENNTKLEIFFLMNNLFSGKLNLNSSSRNGNMQWIDVSSNHIQGELPPSIGYIFPNLKYVDMANNSLQGRIPSSMGNMRWLEFLDLSYNKLTGDLPESLIFGCHSLETLRLSNNALDGQVQPSAAKLNSSLSWLDVSDNHLSGTLPNWIGELRDLKYLVLFSNAFQGPLPSSFCELGLKYLDLSNNDIGPSLPQCLNVSELAYLHLKNTRLRGHFPEFLHGASSLVRLDLSRNALSGVIPTWIGSMSNLETLLLKGNNFSSSIPHQLCHLKQLTTMDLSYNSLSGEIPSCVHISRSPYQQFVVPSIIVLEMTSRMTYGSGTGRSVISYVAGTYSASSDEGVEKIELLLKRRLDRYKAYILGSMCVLDLSSNNLNGSIPPKIGHLTDVIFLNLSNNHLTGAIPSTFAELKEIESLDLSYNKLSGTIPPELIELYRLEVFSVAHNNLTGRTPEQKNQFATFDEKSYEGNSFLCGPPLQVCGGNQGKRPSSTSTLPASPSTQHEEDPFRNAFLWSFGGSYVMAFLGAVAFLFLNSYYTTQAFNFVSDFIPCLRRY